MTERNRELLELSRIVSNISVDDNREETTENGAIHIDLALQLLRSRECDRIRLFSSALCLRSGLLGTSGSLYPRREIIH